MPVIDLGSVVGPQGPQGAPGATGAQGIQGNPGPNQVTDQTSTNLNGVLFGNQSRVTVKPVDSTPTADSTNLVSSGGTKAALDTKANQAQLALIEWGTTASVRHEVGSYFCWNGLLYRTTVVINANDTITPGTNCVQSPASAGLLKQKPFSGTTSSNYGGITDILPSGVGDIAFIRITKVGTSSGINAYAIPFVGTDGKLSSALFYNVVTGALKSTAIEGIAYYV